MATFADIVASAALGEERVEVVHGELVERARATFAHGLAHGLIGTAVGRRFDRKPGGRWPGGWWMGASVDVEYRADEVFTHDLVGWRRERMPERPDAWPMTVRPDWVCEILSPSSTRRDFVDKLRVLHACEVPHYWIANPEEQTLLVYRWAPAGYTVVLAAAAGEAVRAEPFDAVELRVRTLFGDEDDDE